MNMDLNQLDGQVVSLLALCRKYGLNAAETEALNEDSCAYHLPVSLAHTSPEPEALLQAFRDLNQSELEPSTDSQAVWVPENLQGIGLARLDPDYSEDLILDQTKATQILPRQGEIPTEFHNLHHLLADIRLLFGERDWLVFWGQGEYRCWLLALIPWGWHWQLTPWQKCALPLADSVKPLSMAVIQAAADDWRSYMEAPQEELPGVEGNWLEAFAGQLYWSETKYRELCGYAPDEVSTGIPFKACLKSLRVKAKTQKVMETIWDIFRVMPSRLPGYIQQWQEILRWFLPHYLDLDRQIAHLSHWLEERDVLSDSLSRQSSMGTQVYRELKPMVEQIQLMRRNQSGEAPTSRNLLRYPAFRKSWDRFLGDYGHFSPGALDLSEPRFRDRPTLLLEVLLDAPWEESKFLADYELNHQALSPVIWTLKQYIEVREQFVSDTLWALHQMRERLHEQALKLVQKGLLTQAEDIWWLFPNEIESLAQEVKIPSLQIQQRKERYESWGERQDKQRQTQAIPAEIQGEGNHMGLAQGKLWKPLSPYKALPTEIKAKECILVLKTFNSGWIPAAARAQAVILTERGILSRDAMLLSEMGIPCIARAAEIALWSEGEEIRMDSNQGSIVRL